MTVTIHPATNLSPNAISSLVNESERTGWHFVRRLADDLRSGTNRFDQPGEALFVALSDGAVVGICGLNVDPYAGDTQVGRVRRLYVLEAHRGSGLGQRLVQAVVSVARGQFRCLRVRTQNSDAARLFARLGFAAVTGVADFTHMLELYRGDAMLEPLGLQPFVPGGSDFAKSRALFRELGFEEIWASGGYVGFRCGAAKFILQDFDVPEFANNLMLKLEVPDLDAWWLKISAKQLPERFPGFRINPPMDVPWGREVTFLDLAGVCWHVGTP